MESDDGKTIAIVAHLTLIGLIIAFVMHSSNKTKIGAFYLRQSLGLGLTIIALSIVSMIFLFIPFIGWLIGLLCTIAQIAIVVGWVISLIGAINNEEKEVPALGAFYQKIFAGIS